MILLSVTMICLLVIYVAMEIACSKLRTRQNVYAVKTADTLGCIKAFVTSGFMICAGFFTQNMKMRAADLSEQRNIALVEYAPYIFFALGGLLFVFAIGAVMQYLKDY